MSRYICVDCNSIVTKDVREVGIQCDHCGGRIFYKGRSSITKKMEPK